MSLTNQNVIDQALGELGIVEAGTSANSTDSASALTVLNQMMAELAVKDVDLHFPPQDTLADTCPIPKWAEKGVISLLALECAATFNQPISPQLLAKGIEGKNFLAVTMINLNLQKADMSHLATGTGRYNINTDLLN